MTEHFAIRFYSLTLRNILELTLNQFTILSHLG